jgi:hypothetical protein
MRSIPFLVNTPVCSASSYGVPPCRRPPMPQYSPSEFSRTQIMSISAAPRPARGDEMPGISRIGRRFTHCPSF